MMIAGQSTLADRSLFVFRFNPHGRPNRQQFCSAAGDDGGGQTRGDHRVTAQQLGLLCHPVQRLFATFGNSFGVFVNFTAYNVSQAGKFQVVRVLAASCAVP